MPFFGVPIRNGVPIGLGSVAGFGISPFDPSQLFSAGEQGFFYDPSDFSTLFQDSAGTTPVTGVEQVVGLLLDKSKGLVLGPELVTNGDFSAGTTGWAVTAPVTLVNSAGQGVIQRSGGSINDFPRQAILTAGKTYRVQFTVTACSHNVQVYLQDTTASSTFLTNTTGTFAVILIAGSADSLGFRIGPTGDVNATCTVDNISVRELPGNHATSTGAARPTLSARVNLLLATTTLATQNVTTVATTHTLSFSGAGSITLSGTATGTFSAGTHSVVCTAGTLTLTVTGTVTNADLRVANDGVGIPTYQRVNTATDYDTSGFPLYLRFGGTQAMSTGSIDFTATDKMSVFAGVRKLSDAAAAILTEFSADANANNGSFQIFAPVTGGNPEYRYLGRGSISRNVLVSSYAAPITNVLQASQDISGDSIVLRVNSAQVGSSVLDQGTGNFGNYPLYIGSRNLASFFLNGRIYSLAAVGSAVSAGNIAAMENWVAGKTGIVI